MMRKFAWRWALLAVLAAVLIAAGSACKSTTTPSDNLNTEKSYYSTSVQGHTHSITIGKAEIENPPAAGYSHMTSLVNSHIHSFSMSQAELQSVKGGAKLDIETSVDNSHSHTFTIQKWY